MTLTKVASHFQSILLVFSTGRFEIIFKTFDSNHTLIIIPCIVFDPCFVVLFSFIAVLDKFRTKTLSLPASEEQMGRDLSGKGIGEKPAGCAGVRDLVLG